MYGEPHEPHWQLSYGSASGQNCFIYLRLLMISDNFLKTSSTFVPTTTTTALSHLVSRREVLSSVESTILQGSPCHPDFARVACWRRYPQPHQPQLLHRHSSALDAAMPPLPSPSPRQHLNKWPHQYHNCRATTHCSLPRTAHPPTENPKCYDPTFPSSKPRL
jgi:hypothetical protein